MLKVKHLPQFPLVLAMYCFCMLQIPSSGFPQPLVHPPDALDIVQPEQLEYFLNKWAMLSNKPKDNPNTCKRFLFHYSRTQEPARPVKTGAKSHQYDRARKEEQARKGMSPAKVPAQKKGGKNSGRKKFPPVHPLMGLAAKLASRRMKRFLQRTGFRTCCCGLSQEAKEWKKH